MSDTEAIEPSVELQKETDASLTETTSEIESAGGEEPTDLDETQLNSIRKRAFLDVV